jgi:multiple antibiotic resistance protein
MPEQDALMQNWGQYAQSATTLFVITNPFDAVPIFISLTANQTEQERKRTAKIVAATVAVVLIVSIFIGQPLLGFFGISLPSFRVGGGILILLIAIAMLQARPRTRRTLEEAEEAASKEDVAVVPLGIPLVAGPGAISTTIIYAHQATAWRDTFFLVVASIFVAISVWIALSLADPIRQLLGKTGINIVTRLLGLILAAVAVEFIAGGLSQLLPGLVGKS